MKPLRICKICKIGAYTQKELDGFIKDKRCFYGRRNICKKCWNEYNSKWKRENNYSTIDTETRRKVIDGFKKPITCYFCSEKIMKMNGRESHSFIIHSLDGNHNNWKTENKVPAHSGCHTAFHTSNRKKRRLTLEERQQISKSLTGRKLTEEHKKKISLALRGEKHYNWKGDKAKPKSIKHRKWIERKRVN